jgi:hypothetical protein
VKVEILHAEGCSGYAVAERNLKEALSQEGVEAEVELVEVRTDEEARRLRFPGSPTVRVDGRDLFPPAEPPEGGWGFG